MAQLIAVEIPVAHGRLEGLLRLPDAESTDATPPRMAAVVCHPLPTGGGTMHTKVVFRIAQALGELGMPVLRFNFRGVGRSTGTFDGGRGEADDVRAALDDLARCYPGLPLCLAGFSFGSKVGLPVGCADDRVRQLIGVGVPVASLHVSQLTGCDKPKLIVQGARDQYGPLPDLEAWFAQLPEPKSLAVVPEADHFFTHQQQQLLDAILAYFHSGASALGMLAE
ncbi:MAG TPA: alpha/beta family hydrolase [Ktedonobacterales bacterium]|nr:alpha/beta family hydrolase [Ktedonobacterales bacterium]